MGDYDHIVPNSTEQLTCVQARTRSAILDATASVLATNRVATIPEIATAAGVGRTTVHRYFPDRETLIYQATLDSIRVMLETTDQAATEQGPAIEAMRRFITALVSVGDRVLFLFGDPFNKIFQPGVLLAVGPHDRSVVPVVPHPLVGTHRAGQPDAGKKRPCFFGDREIKLHERLGAGLHRHHVVMRIGPDLRLIIHIPIPDLCRIEAQASVAKPVIEDFDSGIRRPGSQVAVDVPVDQGLDAAGKLKTPEAKAYVSHLELSGVNMVASENFMQQKVVEIQGTIANRGTRPLAGIDVYCLFAGVDGREVHRERQPILGTGATRTPLAPNAARPFRLPFDSLPEGWNEAMPKLVIARIQFADKP